MQPRPNNGNLYLRAPNHGTVQSNHIAFGNNSMRLPPIFHTTRLEREISNSAQFNEIG